MGLKTGPHSTLMKKVNNTIQYGLMSLCGFLVPPTSCVCKFSTHGILNYSLVGRWVLSTDIYAHVRTLAVRRHKGSLRFQLKWRQKAQPSLHYCLHTMTGKFISCHQSWRKTYYFSEDYIFTTFKHSWVTNLGSNKVAWKNDGKFRIYAQSSCRLFVPIRTVGSP
jgi:hypothetical protein